ncbi:exodeoxyribonuclease V subunit gamma, partial [Kineococcus sp. R8]
TPGAGPPGAHPVVPLADVESSRVDLAGRFAELLDRLDAVVSSFGGHHPVPHWCDALLEGVLSLTDVPRDGGWQVAQLRRELGAVREDAARAGTARVGLTDVGALLADRLAGRPQRSSFRTGAMTVCTMTPMRSVPHRVVCLLGLDDGAFPRVTGVDGDDLLARAPQVGDRDPRSEDRQVLLDAIGAAERHLVVTYAGRDVRTGAELPPAVPVGELLDALDATAVTHDGRPVREHVVVHHPLQPTDPRNFTAGALGRSGSVSYDRTAHRGALAARSAPAPVPALLDAALPEPPVSDVDLDRLVQFWQHPARGLLRQRLEIAGTVRADEPDNALPVQLDGLQEWAIGDRCLAARLAGVDAVTLARVETARGDLPPGVLGTTLLRRVGARVDRLAAAAATFGGVDQRAVDVELDLPDGTRLTGVVGGVRTTAAGGDVALTTTYSRVKGKQRLRAWLELLALSAAHPSQPWTAVVVGRGSRDSTAVVTLGPVAPAAARAALAELVALRRVGLAVPLPLTAGAGFAWAAARHRGRSPESATESARGEWTSGYSFPREDAEEEHVLLWGADAPFETLLEWTPPPGAPARTPGSFAELTLRVWKPLLDAQRQEEW